MENKIKTVLCIVTLAMMVVAFSVPHIAYAATPLQITVNQVFTTPDGTFTYRLKPLATGNPMPAGSTADGYTFTITGTRSVAFELSGFAIDGLYRYDIFQVITGEKLGYTYDKRVYMVEVYVESLQDIHVIAYNQDGTKAAAITFVNAYGALPSDPGLMVDPPVRKTVFGNPGRDNIFTFKLEAKNPANPMPPGSSNGAKTLQVTGSGKGEFGVWSYSKAGTYFYTVSEINTGEAGYTYDTAIYTITDIVEDRNGQLVLTRVVTNDTNKLVTSLIYNNYYSPALATSAPATSAPATVIRAPVETDDPSPFGKPDDPQNPYSGLPKTGDDANTILFYGMFALGGLVSLGALTCLFTGGKRERGAYS